MTVRELLDALKDQDPHRRVVISNVLRSPWAVVSIQEIKTEIDPAYPDGPVYLRAKDQ